MMSSATNSGGGVQFQLSGKEKMAKKQNRGELNELSGGAFIYHSTIY